jgi:hypothetical protein
VLIDSGSSHLFTNTQVVVQLQGVTNSTYPSSVKVANGALLFSSDELLKVEWVLQGHSF